MEKISELVAEYNPFNSKLEFFEEKFAGIHSWDFPKFTYEHKVTIDSNLTHNKEITFYDEYKNYYASVYTDCKYNVMYILYNLNNYKAISATEGPKYNGSAKGCLTIGKEYDVKFISYQNVPGIWIDEKFKTNPSKAKFYIHVIDDEHRLHSIWNDYFKPTALIREENINKILYE